MATKSPQIPPRGPNSEPEHDSSGAVVMERRTLKAKPPQMYQVLMLNDDYTPMEFVVVVIQEFFGKDLETATQIMLKIHLDGKAVCGHRHTMWMVELAGAISGAPEHAPRAGRDEGTAGAV